MFYETSSSFKLIFALVIAFLLSSTYIFMKMSENTNLCKIYVTKKTARIVNSIFCFRNIFKEKLAYLHTKNVCINIEKKLDFSDMSDVDVQIILLAKVKRGEKNLLKAINYFNKMECEEISKILKENFLLEPITKYFAEQSLVTVYYEDRRLLQYIITEKINESLEEAGFEARMLTFDFKDDYIETLTNKMMKFTTYRRSFDSTAVKY